MIKIKLECWWTDSTSLHNRFINQFLTDEDLITYKFVTESPDFTIVFGRTEWDKIQTKKENTFYISQEPLWSPNQPKGGIHEYCSKILISDKREYDDRDEYIETLIPMFYAGRGEWDQREEFDWSLKLKNKNYTKDKIMSVIVRKDYYNHYNHLSNPKTNIINYRLRTDLAIKLSENKNIDIYGTFWENNGNNLKGEIWNKHLGLDRYKFSVCCENTLQKNYISEKFWDAILTDTVPIYLGCTNIDELVPKDCFIYLNDMSIDQMVNKIEETMENASSLYEYHSEKIKKLKQDFFSNDVYNLWERIKKLML